MAIMIHGQVLLFMNLMLFGCKHGKIAMEIVLDGMTWVQQQKVGLNLKEKEL